MALDTLNALPAAAAAHPQHPEPFTLLLQVKLGWYSHNTLKGYVGLSRIDGLDAIVHHSMTIVLVGP